MRNQQIGIGIVHCLTKATTTGYDKVFTSDNEQWSNLIDDTGDVFKYIKLTQLDIVVRMIKFVRDGWYMCSMKPVHGRDGEYRACWIYFPVSLDIDANGIEYIINHVEKEIKTNDFNEQSLRNIADKYSQMSEHAAFFKVPNQQQGFAIRYVDEGYQSLYDIYGNIYQKDFAKYNWVILMPKSSVEVKIQGNIDDITSAKLIGSHVVILNAKDGFVPYHNGQEFCNAIRITEEETLTIEWRKDGYRPIQKKGQKEADFEISRNDYERIFRVDLIKVYDSETGRQLNRPRYKFNSGRWSDDKKEVYIKEDQLSNVEVTVSVDTYVSETIPLNLSNQVEKTIINIRLRPEKHSYVFKIQLDNGEYITTEQYISQKQLTECPIRGYECVDRIREDKPNSVRYVGIKGKVPAGEREDNYLENNANRDYPKKRPWYKRINWNVLILILFILLICAIGYVGYKMFFDGPKTTIEYIQPAKDYEQGDSAWDDAKAYINSGKTKWVKTEMDQYKDLEGLYDFINNYKFNEIKKVMDKHKDDFNGVDVYKRLYDIAIRKPYKRGPYSEDGSITIENYLKRLQNTDDVPLNTSSENIPNTQQYDLNSSNAGNPNSTGNKATDKSPSTSRKNAKSSSGTTNTSNSQNENI